MALPAGPLTHFSPARTHESPAVVVEAVFLSTAISPTETCTRPVYASPSAVATGLLPGDSWEFGDMLHTFKESPCTLQLVLRVVGSREASVELSFRESCLIGNSLHEYLVWESGPLEAQEAILETAYVVELPPMAMAEDQSELTRRLQVFDCAQRLIFSRDWHETVGVLNEDAIDWLRTCHHPLVVPESMVDAGSSAEPPRAQAEVPSAAATPPPSPSASHLNHHRRPIRRTEGGELLPPSRSPSISGSFVSLEPHLQSPSLSRSDSVVTLRSPTSEPEDQRARAVDLLQQVGFWIYGTTVGQLMTNALDPRENYKKLYSPSPIWLMGSQFRSKVWDSHVGWRRVVALRPIQKLLYRALPGSLSAHQRPARSYLLIEWLRIRSCDASHLIALLASWLESRLNGEGDANTPASTPPWTIQYHRTEQDQRIVLEAARGDAVILSLVHHKDDDLVSCQVTAPRGNALEARTMFAEVISQLWSLSPGCALIDEGGRDGPAVRVERLLLHAYGSQITEGPYPQIPNSKRPSADNPPAMMSGPMRIKVLLWSAHLNDWISRLIIIDLSLSTLTIRAPEPWDSATELELKGCTLFAFDDDSRRFTLADGAKGWVCFRALSANDFDLIANLAAKIGTAAPPRAVAANAAPQTLPPLPMAPLQTTELPSAIDDNPGEMGGLDEFLDAFEACFWFTYRRDLPRLVPSILSSDAGFGCMLRAGQSMMAEALARLILGRMRNLDRILADADSRERYKAVGSP